MKRAVWSVERFVASKDIDLKPGNMVLPHSGNVNPTVYLTPLDEDLAREFERWIEWLPGQPGIVLDVTQNSLQHASIKVLTPQGIGVCFSNELKMIL